MKPPENDIFDNSAVDQDRKSSEMVMANRRIEALQEVVHQKKKHGVGQAR